MLGTGSAFSQAKKPIHSLNDVPVFKAALGKWKGVGVGFDIVEDRAKEGVTHRDEWEAKFRRNAHVLEMTGLVTRQGGVELPYSWVFRFNGNRDKITASYEMATGQEGTLEVLLIADGRRVQIRRPKGAKTGIDMEMDIYFDKDDLVIDSLIRNVRGEEVYKSSTRYTKNGDAPE
ncbi:MAG: hypothetical protein HKN23_05040 [Verrucomicrobiales bacterium]|nr:hypothetical protein [Verrucomicrobiales bacterium]